MDRGTYRPDDFVTIRCACSVGHASSLQLHVTYAASGTARALARACDSRASITRSAWSATRSSPRTRSGAKPYSFLSRPS
jgi:hypothetical protein